MPVVDYDTNPFPHTLHLRQLRDALEKGLPYPIKTQMVSPLMCRPALIVKEEVDI